MVSPRGRQLTPQMGKWQLEELKALPMVTARGGAG